MTRQEYDRSIETLLGDKRPRIQLTLILEATEIVEDAYVFRIKTRDPLYETWFKDLAGLSIEVAIVKAVERLWNYMKMVGEPGFLAFQTFCSLRD